MNVSGTLLSSGEVWGQAAEQLQSATVLLLLECNRCIALRQWMNVMKPGVALDCIVFAIVLYCSIDMYYIELYQFDLHCRI